MSTKLIGIGVLAGCLTAAVGGYVTLREPVAPVAPIPVEEPTPVPQAIPAAGPVPAPEPEPAPVLRIPAAGRVPARSPKTPPPPATTAEPIVSEATPAPPTPSAPTPPAPTPATPAAEAPRYIPDPAPIPPPVAVVETSPQFDEVVVERHSVIGIRLDYAVSTRTARVEDRITATVSRAVTVQGRVAIPDGAKLEGTITDVEHGGKFRNRPRLGLRFDTMILTDGTRLSIKTDTIYREGDSPSADAAARVGGGAVAGVIIGAVLGGKKGAAIGGAAGAAGGAATVMTGDDEETALAAGAPLTVRLTEDLSVLVKRH